MINKLAIKMGKNVKFNHYFNLYFYRLVMKQKY